MITPNPLNEDRAVEQLTLHEGLRLKLYKDSKAIGTIGIGFNYQARGVAPINAIVGHLVVEDDLQAGRLPASVWVALCRQDIRTLDAQLCALSVTYQGLSEVRKRVLVDLAYNIGLAGALKFERLFFWLGKAEEWDGVPDQVEAAYTAAAFELMNSHYAHDVGDGLGGQFDRADRLCQMLISGLDYTK